MVARAERNGIDVPLLTAALCGLQAHEINLG
jgi:hypothetical protein